MDLMEMPMVSYHKYKYVMIIVDDYTSYIWGGLLRAKNDAITYFEHWFKHQKNRFPNYVITYVCTDHGGEFTSSKFEDFLKNQGIMHQKSTAHIHQQNGRAERANQTILYKSEAMRLEASCPKSWWEFSIETAVHLYNRTPFRRSQWKTPSEMISGNKPDVSYLRVFRCMAWVFIPSEIRVNKLTPKSEVMTFVGYEPYGKAYRFMTNENKLVISSQAIFDENKYPRSPPSKDIATKDKDPLWPLPVDESPKFVDLPDSQSSNRRSYPRSNK